ncbi:MAG: hypothetical protein JOZ05_06120, partial [Acetobacteraceae bacterium]|nr:hypothetical protein [Acetobacteraceae bacterium]
MSEYVKTMADFWSAQGKAMLEAQEKAARSITDSMQAVLSGRLPTVPDGASDLGAVTGELGQASDALMQLWSAATSLSTELAGKLTKH